MFGKVSLNYVHIDLAIVETGQVRLGDRSPVGAALVVQLVHGLGCWTVIAQQAIDLPELLEQINALGESLQQKHIYINIYI
jgi:hypothetical protein